MVLEGMHWTGLRVIIRRYQCVNYKNELLDKKEITCGVP